MLDNNELVFLINTLSNLPYKAGQSNELLMIERISNKLREELTKQINESNQKNESKGS